MSRAKTAARRKPIYLSTLLKSLGACEDSIAFAQSRRGKPGGLRATWEACVNGGWMIWLASRLHLRGDLPGDAYLAVRDAYYGTPWTPDYDAFTTARADAIRAAVDFERVLAALEHAAVAS